MDDSKFGDVYWDKRDNEVVMLLCRPHAPRNIWRVVVCVVARGL